MYSFSFYSKKKSWFISSIRVSFQKTVLQKIVLQIQHTFRHKRQPHRTRNISESKERSPVGDALHT
jgi:hypothetical protein